MRPAVRMNPSWRNALAPRTLSPFEFLDNFHCVIAPLRSFGLQMRPIGRNYFERHAPQHQKPCSSRHVFALIEARWLVPETHWHHSLILSLLTIRSVHRMGRIKSICHTQSLAEPQRGTKPPSTDSSIPVIPLLSPDARYTAAWAI